jgi:Tol biopolymer transport system component
MGMAAVLLVALMLLTLLAACGGSEPTARVVFITATFTPEPGIMVVTATPSPQSPAVGAVADTPLPPPTQAEQPSDTPPLPPTATPDQVLTAQAILTAFATPQAQPTDTPIPVPPTETPVPAQPVATAKPSVPKSNPAQWWVAYTVVRPPFDNQSYSIWMMRGNGAEAEKVIDNASEPSFTLNAGKLAYYHWNDGIWVIDLSKETNTHVVHNQWTGFPSFSPDGAKIAFQENVWPRKIHVVNADGTGDSMITEGQRPFWSPKGGLIAYDSCISNDCGIFTIQPNGKGRQQLTKDAGGAPAISPDGKKIAYQSAADGDNEIYVMNVDGSGKKQLTKNNFNDALAAWSPDGQYIYFRSDQAGKGWAIMRMRADGSDRAKIIDALVSPEYWEWEKMSIAKEG